ncbi:hypothetical protein P154DRAFT_469810 [Amniculicola lignicola CBS 123094]|uniref:PH domain-containing protein n=1 Tax=Amniculicola lignicola CBS 123094 TaxID=1392246 RepID=A0A6A5WB68_9PLEO|nr:hypothetical protein P154DRAFT_469810 [Amniculicola lignicola CBS 123094]
MAADTASPEPAPAKFSRYRSVRRAQEKQESATTAPAPALPTMPPMPPMPVVEQKPETAISRSMSRYHRRPAQTASPVRSQTEAVPALPADAQTTARIRAVSSPQQAPRVANSVQPRLPNTSKSRSEAAQQVAKGAHDPFQRARDEAKQLMHDEAERQKRMQEKIRAEKRAKLEAQEAERAKQENLERLERLEKLRKETEEAERLHAQREAEELEYARRHKEEQEHGRRLRKSESAARTKQREEERKAKHEAAPKPHASPPVSPPRHGAGFGLFKRRKDEAPTSPEPAGRPRQTSNGNREHDTIRPGGGGAVLGIDAPKSAVNAGDRRVMIVCNKSHMQLPVTPTTTPLDLIKSAATVLTESIDVRTAVVLESFQKVGLTRALRNYEHVRDVMNSWDDDKQNDLIISDCASSDIDQDALLSSQVPDDKPTGMGCYIHYSSKPGKWSKRYIALREDGQLHMSKNENAKEKDQEAICHLSDFDIYSPTERKLTKVKPPKKICYAVKSQQKSNIFSDETRFVHFFCTNDKTTASQFYKAVQGWRSWYLKHVMGQKQKGPEPKANRKVLGGAAGLPPMETSHARGASVGSHYQLGTFSPLIDFDSFGKEPKETTYQPGSLPDDAPLGKLNTRTMHARKMSTRAKGPPPLSYALGTSEAPPPTANRQNSLQSSSSQSDGDTFASGGLLGRTYSQRQRVMQDREKKSSGPFTEGPNLLNNNDSGLGRRSSVRSTHQRSSSDVQRSGSTRLMPKPLIDLTPQYKEPPQHALKGRRYVPEGSAGPLVESATSPEEAIKIPPSTDWRTKPTTARPHGTYGTGGHERTRSLRGRGEGLAAYTVNNHSGAPEDDSNAFTGGGLLAKAGFSQGHTPVGHGVMDGSKAKGPMLDLRENTRFASGSLLATVERIQGPGGPVIDRDKRRSVDLG